MPATPITLSSSEQAECYPRFIETSPDGQYSASFMGERVEILDKERLRMYHIPYRVSDFMFSPDSSQLAFKAYLNPDNWSIFIVNLNDGVLRQAFHVSELPNYSKSERMKLQEWNSAGILIDLYDSDAEKPFSYELFDPNSSQFETIGFGYMSFVIKAMASHNARFIMQSRDNPEPPDSEGTLIFLFDRENDTEQFIDESDIYDIFLSGFSSDDRYFAYSHFIENGKYRVILLDLDTMTSKELVLDQSLGSLNSVEWYGKEQKLLLTIDHKTEFIKYLLPIDNFDLDHLTRLPNTP